MEFWNHGTLNSKKWPNVKRLEFWNLRRHILICMLNFKMSILHYASHDKARKHSLFLLHVAEL